MRNMKIFSGREIGGSSVTLGVRRQGLLASLSSGVVTPTARKRWVTTRTYGRLIVRTARPTNLPALDLALGARSSAHDSRSIVHRLTGSDRDVHQPR